jgi:allophanate hydrolase
VPAAFNGLVGIKPTRGLIPTTGVFPASPSLDCVSTFTRTVAEGRAAVEAMIGLDEHDPYGRPMPPVPPPGIARVMRVIAIPSGRLDLDPQHARAWDAALVHARSVARVVEVDVAPLLEAAALLYGSALLAERLAAVGQALYPDGAHLDPTVRAVVLAARRYDATDVFRAQEQLARLRRAAAAVFIGADAVLLPTTPMHPTLAEVAADPVGVNARLGTYTNMANLLDLCAVAVPAGLRPDGLPFGAQLLAPAFADRPLHDLAARWCGESITQPAAGGMLLAVAGAHLTGQPANAELVELGGRLHRRARTASGYRMYSVPGPFPRPGLVPADGGPSDGFEVEIWELPTHGLGQLLARIAEPLSLGQLELDDGTAVTGFLATGALDSTRDISQYGGWRAYRASPNPAATAAQDHPK